MFNSGTLFNSTTMFNVKDFGAIGDGLHDDTSAIQTTINVCIAAGGGAVLFPPGTYQTSGGSGTGLTSLTIDGASNLDVIGNGAVINQGAGSARVLGIFYSNNIKIRGLKIVGYAFDNPTTGAQGNALITINFNSESILIEDCYLTNSLGDQLYIGGSLVDGTLLGYTPKHITITHCTLKSRFGNGIIVWAPSGTGTMSRNAIAVTDADGVIITDNIIYGTVDLEPNSNYQGVRFVNISDNQFLEGPVMPQASVGTNHNYDEPFVDDGGVFRPLSIPTLSTSATGGSLPSGSIYYAKITYACPTYSTETVASPESLGITTSGTSTNTITVTGGAVPSGPAAMQVNVYLTLGSTMGMPGTEVYVGNYTSGTSLLVTLPPSPAANVPPASIPEGIGFDGTPTISDTNFNLVQGNYFDNAAVSVGGIFVGNIIGNYFKFGYIQVGLASTVTQEVVVADNYFTFIQRAIPNWAGTTDTFGSPNGAAIQVQNTGNCVFESNTLVFGPSQYLLSIQNEVARNTYRLNQFVDTAGAGLFTGTGFASNSVVADNFFAGAPFVETYTTSPINVPLSNNYVLMKYVSAGSPTVNLPSAPPIGTIVTVKDAQGNAATKNITVAGPSTTIDSAANYIINTAYGFRTFLFNGTEWNVVA